MNPEDPGQPTASNVRLGRLIAGLALLLLLLAMLAASQGAAPNLARLTVLIAVLAEEGALIVGWFAAAAGFGFPLRRLLIETPGPAPAAGDPAAAVGRGFLPLALQLTLGVATLLLAAALLGWAGGLNRITGWGLMVVGWATLGGQIWRSRGQPGTRRLAAPVHWSVLLPAPACGLLLVAAMIAPGVLWQLPEERMAYDVLSYHLQLPKEWLADGAIVGYHHNVYSYLPNLLEAGYLHLAALHGSAIDAGVTAQMLHAAMALLTAGVIAIVVGVLCRRGRVPTSGLDDNAPSPAATISGRAAAGAGVAAAAAYLATPWVLATGSLAFNEQAVNLLLAGALLAAIDLPDRGPGRRGVTVGLLIGTAVLVKLTAVGMVALPLVALLLVSPGGPEPMADPWRRRGRMLLGTGVAAAAVVLTWLVRNAIWTGNPVFPMAAEWLGSAHWTAEQVARWNAAHTPDLPLLDRLARLGTHLFGHRLFGYTLLPAGVLGLALALRSWPTRRVAAALLVAMGVQLLFWLAATHVQSRFMVPALVPASIGAGLLFARPGFRPAPILVVVVPMAFSFLFYFSQANGAAAAYLDATRFMTDEHPVYGTVNRLPADSGRVYAEGWATPFYARPDVTYHTVWDASPLGELFEQHGLDGAIRRLQSKGYDLLVVDYGMLRRWLTRGNYGYDPRLTVERLRELAAANLPVVARTEQGLIVYRLR